jgi:hypothetical protein
MLLPSPLSLKFHEKRYEVFTLLAQQIKFHLADYLNLHELRGEFVWRFGGAPLSCLLFCQQLDPVWLDRLNSMNIGSRLMSRL